jgi:hypothetical protein
VRRGKSRPPVRVPNGRGAYAIRALPDTPNQIASAGLVRWSLRRPSLGADDKSRPALRRTTRAGRGAQRNAPRRKSRPLIEPGPGPHSLLLLISASFHWPHSPATSLQASLVPPLADRLLAAMRPCLRATFPLLGRCLTARNRNKRSAKHGDEDSSENKMCHDYLPNTCRRAQILWPYSRTDHWQILSIAIRALPDVCLGIVSGRLVSTRLLVGP